MQNTNTGLYSSLPFSTLHFSVERYYSQPSKCQRSLSFFRKKKNNNFPLQFYSSFMNIDLNVVNKNVHLHPVFLVCYFTWMSSKIFLPNVFLSFLSVIWLAIAIWPYSLCYSFPLLETLLSFKFIFYFNTYQTWIWYMIQRPMFIKLKTYIFL